MPTGTLPGKMSGNVEGDSTPAVDSCILLFLSGGASSSFTRLSGEQYRSGFKLCKSQTNILRSVICRIGNAVPRYNSRLARRLKANSIEIIRIFINPLLHTTFTV